jgi:Domain of unknown function (DUF4168)
MMLLTKNVSHTLTKIALTTSLAVAGIAMGIIPEFSDSFSRLNWGDQVLAQPPTNEEINKYAEAVLTIEPLRQQAFNEIGKIMGVNSINNVSCDQPQSLSSLNQQARPIFQTYCQSSKKIVENTGLTAKKFNEITQTAQSNQELQRRIQDAMIQLRSK